MLEGQEITIIGAGIGGLAAALALAQRGARVRLLEQAAEIAEVGAGLQISPNGVRVLEALGLGDVARARSSRTQTIWLRDGPTGRSVLELDLETLAPDASFLLFHRADLQGLLLEAALEAGVEVQTGSKLVSVTPGEDATGIELADGRREDVNFLVAADGLNSALRSVLNMPAKPFFTGQVAWRALVPATGREEAEVAVYMGPGRHMVTYPLRDGQFVNLVAIEERKNWVEEGWFHRDDVANLRTAFAGFCPDAQAILERVNEVYLWGLHRHEVALEWHRGRSALLGDAAHPTLPFMAQGAVMALEDAWALADSLAAMGLQDGPALYQARRRSRTERVVEAANKNARNYHYSNPLARGLGHGLLRFANKYAPGRVLGRFDWIYKYDVTKQ